MLLYKDLQTIFQDGINTHPIVNNSNDLGTRDMYTLIYFNSRRSSKIQKYSFFIFIDMKNFQSHADRRIIIKLN